jgi:Fe-S cluster biogenesis protein NfuA
MDQQMIESEDVLGRIETALAAVRPALQADGGDILFRGLRENGVMDVQWLGTCARCPLSIMTLRAGVERIVMKDVPEVKRIEVVSGR